MVYGAPAAGVGATAEYSAPSTCSQAVAPKASYASIVTHRLLMSRLVRQVHGAGAAREVPLVARGDGITTSAATSAGSPSPKDPGQMHRWIYITLCGAPRADMPTPGGPTCRTKLRGSGSAGSSVTKVWSHGSSWGWP